MNIIVIGNGGREHAIAWKISQSPKVEKVVCVPGNGGTAFEEKCINIQIDKSDSSENPYIEIAKKENCTLAVIGPEDPLAEGLADEFWKAGIPCVGPKKDAAQLEASKDLAKEFMKKYNVACAKSETFTDQQKASDYVRKHGAPIVIKADGLAAGKGVTVAATIDEAIKAIDDIMNSGRVGDAGKKLVIEDYLEGVEISVLSAVSVFKDGKEKSASIIPFLPARDHKRLNDGAKGPNTGGMGAVCPLTDVTDKTLKQFKKDILEPTLKGLKEEGFDYRGFIFFGVMLTKNGPKLLEYNVRLGDPETQAVLPLMNFDFVEMCEAIVSGKLNKFKFAWKKGFQVAPVMVSGGYPFEYEKEKVISFSNEVISKTGAKVFIAGAKVGRRSNSTELVTSGGRVLACSAFGETFEKAWKNAYIAISGIKFDGCFYRRDIGLPGAAESGNLK